MAVETITLTDAATGSETTILAGFGFNCCRFRVVLGGQKIDVLWSEAGFETGEKRGSGSGIPILFPYPGRLRGKSLLWDGRPWPLEGDDHRGNAIHGSVLARPWRVVEQSGTHVVGQFQASADEPSLLDRWPADFRITARYEVAGRALKSSFLVENPGERPLPFGFGTHPYFCVPVGGASADDCRVELPVRERWELVEMLPTGRRLAVEDPAVYRSGLPFGSLRFDDVFTGLGFESGWCTCRIVDPRSGHRIEVEFDTAFRECVVYNPPHRQAVCIEPYTCVPNAPELSQRGIETGLRVLPPGEQFRAFVNMRVE
jgi:aldose 1-epimerase